jgi:hypothetical protein
VIRWLVFNGDADGICAAHQLRLAGYAADRVVTGVKRDITLLDRVDAAPGDCVVVADISLDANRAGLTGLLGKGVKVDWYDHHYAGEIPASGLLVTHIRTDAETCSSLIVDATLDGRFRNWAVAAAFGDNLHAAARAAGIGLDAVALAGLRELGELMNYNAYGETVEDLHEAPARLYERIARFVDPLDFIAADDFVVRLREGFAADMALARALAPERANDCAAVHVLPDAPWARRVNGVFANELAREAPGRAHAILVATGSCYMVSVRAPKVAPSGADALCRGFATGGGRAAAAGINALPVCDLAGFLEAFGKAFGGASSASANPR